MAAAAGVATVALGSLIWRLQAQGRSAAALAMATDMDMRNMATYWAFPVLQSSGIVALLLAWLAVLLGLWHANHRAAGRCSIQVIDDLHRHVSLGVLALVLVHMIATACDAMGDSWRTVLLPGIWAQQGWPEAVTGYNTGISAAYLLLIAAPSYYLRHVMGHRRWRILHRLVVAFYGLSILHAMILGLDLAYYDWARPLLWLAQIPLLLMLMRRMLRAIEAGGRAAGPMGVLTCWSCWGLLVLSGVLAIGLLGLVLSGHSGVIATV